MKNTILIFLTALLFACSSTQHAVSQKVFTPADGNLMGRAIKNADSTVTLSASAASCTVSFTGLGCVVYLKNATPNQGDYNYVNFELDGMYIGRQKVDVQVAVPYIIKAVGNDMQHKLVISKATEAANGQIIITKIDAQNLTVPKESFKTKIEFIGNSITCGFGNDMEVPCGNGSKWYDQHNAYWSYASRTARAVNAAYMISAISGAGIYRNWNSDGPTVPQQYENAFLNTDSANKWNFNSYVPDIVTIALGTNDMSNGDGKTARFPFDKLKYIAAYKKFIKTIYSHYPDAQLVLLNSPMVGGQNNLLLQECITSVQNEINKEVKPVKPIKTFWFNAMQPKGCGYHPSITDHEVMANQLIPFIKQLLKQ
jgi:lysophospholipase L1-like esterase